MLIFRKIYIIIILLLIVRVAKAQDTNSLNESAQEITFVEYVAYIEAKNTYQFYFDSIWIGNLKINVVDTSQSIESTLLKTFLGSNLDYFIDNNSIIIYTGRSIPKDLPNYVMLKEIVDSSEKGSGAVITKAEERYLKGKQVADLELITVGSKQKSTTGKTYLINGIITDEETGEPIIGATIFIKELDIGCATDLDGFFNIPLESGSYLVEVNSLAMKEKRFHLQVYSDGKLEIPLKKELVNINEVTITANKIDNVRGMQMGFERLSAKSIKEIPAIMGEKDIIKVAEMLPGVQSSGEGSAGISVRGGAADQNLFYINKMPVYNTSHLFGFFTAFNPHIVSDFSLYKSNIPAKYGGRVSSIFDISMRQGNKKEFFAQGGISPITGHISAEGPIIKDKVSYVLSYRATYSDWILSQTHDINLQNSQASFYDVTGAINAKVNDKNMVKFFIYNSNDRFSLASTNDYRYNNSGGSISWKHFYTSALSMEVSGIISKYRFGHDDKTNPSEAHTQEYNLNHNELKADFNYVTKNNHRISFGASTIDYQLNRGEILPYNDESARIPINLGEEQGMESALYISDEINIIPRLNILAGLRYSFYSQIGSAVVNEYFPNTSMVENNVENVETYDNNKIVKSYSGPEPRIALNYILTDNTSLKASYNRNRQYIFMLSNTISISPTDQWKLADYHLKPPISDQISFGLYQDFPEKAITTSIEVYNKWTKNIIDYKDGADFITSKPIETMLLQGNQDTYGVEFMLRKTTGKYTGWLSYTYSKSMVQISNSSTGESINNGKAYPSNLDRPHSFSLVTNMRSNRRLSLSTNVIYSTGRPITYPVALYYSEGQEVLHYSGRNEYRIPDYFRIDLSINLEGNLLYKKWIHSFWMLNIYNLTGRRNAYSVYFEAKDGAMQGYKLSVFGQPIVTLSWNFKFGNYSSE